MNMKTIRFIASLLRIDCRVTVRKGGNTVMPKTVVMAIPTELLDMEYDRVYSNDGNRIGNSEDITIEL